MRRECFTCGDMFTQTKAVKACAKRFYCSPDCGAFVSTDEPKERVRARWAAHRYPHDWADYFNIGKAVTGTSALPYRDVMESI